jgi:hypothetical protein
MLFLRKIGCVVQAGKQVGAAHLAKNIITLSRPLKLLHMNLFGPIAYISIGGNKYGCWCFLCPIEYVFRKRTESTTVALHIGVFQAIVNFHREALWF